MPQAHPARANVRRGKAEGPLAGDGYHPIPTRHYPPTPDTPTPQADGALASPAKPARKRPAGRAGDPGRPAIYPGGTWHPPPVDLRRHWASPSDHADASDSAESSAFSWRMAVRANGYPVGAIGAQPPMRKAVRAAAFRSRPDRRFYACKGFVRYFLSTCDIFLVSFLGLVDMQCNRAGFAGRRTVQGRATRMEGSGVVTITGRMLTIGGHQIETITIATRRNAGGLASSTRRSRSHGIGTSEPAQSREPCTTGVHVPPQA